MAGLLGCLDGSFHGTWNVIITFLIHQVRQQPADGGPSLLVLDLGHGQQAVFNVVGKGCSGCDGLLLGCCWALEMSLRMVPDSATLFCRDSRRALSGS